MVATNREARFVQYTNKIREGISQGDEGAHVQISPYANGFLLLSKKKWYFFSRGEFIELGGDSLSSLVKGLTAHTPLDHAKLAAPTLLELSGQNGHTGNDLLEEDLLRAMEFLIVRE